MHGVLTGCSLFKGNFGPLNLLLKIILILFVCDTVQVKILSSWLLTLHWWVAWTGWCYSRALMLTSCLSSRSRNRLVIIFRRSLPLYNWLAPANKQTALSTGECSCSQSYLFDKMWSRSFDLNWWSESLCPLIVLHFYMLFLAECWCAFVCKHMHVFPGKDTCLWNDLLCVKWNVKHC